MATLFRLIVGLGLSNILSVLFYRLKCRIGIYRIFSPIEGGPVGRSFSVAEEKQEFSVAFSKDLIEEANEIMSGRLRPISGPHKTFGSPPEWFRCQPRENGVHWSKTGVNVSTDIDVKDTWDLSRFGWGPVLAAAHNISGEAAYLDTLNSWVEDWWNCNPVNEGVNWICGQETGLRLLSLLFCLRFVGFDKSSLCVPRAVYFHCRRILETHNYALAQDNNHAIAEAVALFVGGSWLVINSESAEQRKLARKSSKQGRASIEKTVSRLVASDGGFSMYSTNYQKVVIELLIKAEFWRAHLNEPRFSDGFYKSASNATMFLHSMVDPQSGHAPLIGHNDGSSLFDLRLFPKSDFRPTLQVAASFFLGRRLYLSMDDELTIYGQESLSLKVSEAQRHLPKYHRATGFCVVCAPDSDAAWLIMRIPVFAFRPSHSDVFHIDLWVGGENLLRDAGTFGYNVSSSLYRYFVGTKAHNTIEFDDRDQMPMLGKFLLGGWLKTLSFVEADLGGGVKRIEASYVDRAGAKHSREITLSDGSLRVVDTVSGFKSKAVLRWRLSGGDWLLRKSEAIGRGGMIQVTSTTPIHRFELTEGLASPDYQQLIKIPVLETEIHQAGVLVTEYRW